jgi:hypothetical protein
MSAALTREDVAIFFRRTTLRQRIAYRTAHLRDVLMFRYIAPAG